MISNFHDGFKIARIFQFFGQFRPNVSKWFQTFQTFQIIYKKICYLESFGFCAADHICLGAKVILWQAHSKMLIPERGDLTNGWKTMHWKPEKNEQFLICWKFWQQDIWKGVVGVILRWTGSMNINRKKSKPFFLLRNQALGFSQSLSQLNTLKPRYVNSIAEKCLKM